MKNMLLAALLALLSCKQKGRTDPPPLVEGRCVVDRFYGDVVSKQTCVHGGYNWVCTYDGSEHSCERTGEAGGERPAQDAGVVVPDAQ